MVTRSVLTVAALGCLATHPAAGQTQGVPDQVVAVRAALDFVRARHPALHMRFHVQEAAPIDSVVAVAETAVRSNASVGDPMAVLECGDIPGAERSPAAADPCRGRGEGAGGVVIVEIQELRIGGSDGYVRVVLHTAGARAGPLEASEWGLNLERHHGSWALQEAKLLAET